MSLQWSLHTEQFLTLHSVYNISRYQYIRQEVRLTTNHKPLGDLHLRRLALYGYTVTLNINYFWLQPFKYSFVYLVLYHVCKQGPRILVQAHFKYTYTILFWLLALYYLWCVFPRGPHASQVLGLADLLWLAHKIENPQETAPSSLI